MLAAECHVERPAAARARPGESIALARDSPLEAEREVALTARHQLLQRLHFLLVSLRLVQLLHELLL